MYVSDPLLEAEREKERRRQETYGESPAWIRRVVEAYGRSEEYKWRALLRQAARGSRADIPLGAPISVGDAAKRTSTGVPRLATASTRSQTGPVLSTIKPARRQQTAPNQTFIPTQPNTKRPTMDLGSIIENLGREYLERRFPRPVPTFPGPFPDRPPIMTTPVGDDTYGVNLLRRLPGAGGVARLPAAIGRMSTADKIGTAIGALGLGLAADEIAAIAETASKVKCRRKRRRLATHSDIKDLAALKSVLGSGKAFDTWIATRRM